MDKSFKLYFYILDYILIEQKVLVEQKKGTVEQHLKEIAARQELNKAFFVEQDMQMAPDKTAQKKIEQIQLLEHCYCCLNFVELDMLFVRMMENI